MKDNRLEKIELKDKIRLLILKHRGELSKVANEAGVDLATVEKIAKEFQKKRNQDVSLHVASFLTTEILSGHEARIAYIRQALARLEDETKRRVSSCCGFDVDETDDPPVCLKCKHECTIIHPKLNLAEYRKLLDLWLQEDLGLAEFSEKMGLTFKENTPQTPVIQKNYQLILGDSPRKQIESNQIDTSEAQVLQQAQDLSPVAREQLRKALESKLLELGDGKNEENPNIS